MKLPIVLTREGMLRGKISRAKLGQWEETARSNPKAVEALAVLIYRMATENGEPVVRYDVQGHAWVAQRDNGGSWSYYMLEASGTKRCVCVVSGGRDRCVEMMEGHMRQWCEVNS